MKGPDYLIQTKSSHGTATSIRSANPISPTSWTKAMMKISRFWFALLDWCREDGFVRCPKCGKKASQRCVYVDCPR